MYIMDEDEYEVFDYKETLKDKLVYKLFDTLIWVIGKTKENGKAREVLCNFGTKAARKLGVQIMQLLNAFSLQMLDLSTYQNVTIFPADVWQDSGKWIAKIDGKDVPLAELDSKLGHPDIANILGCQMNRVSSHLDQGETALVAQVMGGRLPEGVTTLPEGIKIGFFFVKVN